MKIILCAYHWAGCKAVQTLFKENKHDIFVYTHDSPYHVPDLVEFCEENDIPYSTENISKSELPFKPDVICSIYYRYIIKQHIIEACEGKIFNLHPSLLPNYKGCSSLTWAMINGETKTGYTFHYIDTHIDTGRILFQEEINIEYFDNQSTLYNRVMFEAMKNFKAVLQLVVDEYKGTEQPKGGNYYKRGCPFDGVIDPTWDKPQTKRFIKAMIHPPYPLAKFNEQTIGTYKEFLALDNDN